FCPSILPSVRLSKSSTTWKAAWALTSGEVVLDPAGGSNQVLKVSTESGTLDKAASVAQDTTRMLFLRFRFEEHGRYSFGLSHLLNPDEYSDFGPESGMADATASDPNNDFRVANGLTDGIYDELATLVPGTWYNTWTLVDNTSETYEVWMNSDPGGDAQASDQLSNDAPETVFGFRTKADADLINFFIKTGGGNSPVDGRFYIDDIYLEDTDDINLNNPVSAVPIPAAVWLFGSGLLGLIGIARRKKAA
ncbi:MAG: VPLPA-CTERM sorting domain-containing protein, partial [Pseudomonadota bacterium]|nr:VPLPA-CTERM sorting domain-containing protein [Pseudomonadota bacterium]